MGFFDFFKPKIKERSTLSGPQERVMRALGQSLPSAVANGPEQFLYKGRLTADLTPAERALVDRAASVFSNQAGTLSRLGSFDPVEFNRTFEQEVARPQVEFFKRELLPLITESAPAFSVERAKLTTNALRDLHNSLLQQRFQERQAFLNRALNTALGAPSAFAQQLQTVGLPRFIEQAGLDREFSNFANANKTFIANVQAAVEFLKPQTKYAYKAPSDFDVFMNAYRGIKEIVSDMVPFIKKPPIPGAARF